MPWKVRGKCVYKKDTGKKVGCTKGSVKKYLTALHINAHESTKPKTFKEFYNSVIKEDPAYASNMPGMNGDQTGVQEGEYADENDETTDIGVVDEEINKRQIIYDIIGDLEDLAVSHNWSKPVDKDLVKAMADSIKDAGIEPTDLDAAVNATPELQYQYLITGPSAWKGGNGALKDLKAILAGNEPEELDEDDADPSSATSEIAPDVCTDGGAAASVGDNIGENFLNHKGPGRSGDSKRHGIKKHTTLASLDKIVHSRTASPRKKQLAHWQANMRRGKAGKK